MPTAAALDATRDLASRLRRRYGDRVLWVRLYGSQARGDATERSDVDVAAVIRDLTWNEKIEAIDLACEVSLARGVHVSAMVTSEAEFARLLALELRFAGNVIAEGIAA